MLLDYLQISIIISIHTLGVVFAPLNDKNSPKENENLTTDEPLEDDAWDVLPRDIILIRQPYAYPAFTGDTYFQDLDKQDVLAAQAKKLNGSVVKDLKKLFQKNNYCYQNAKTLEKVCTNKLVIPSISSIRIQTSADDKPMYLSLFDVEFEKIENVTKSDITMSSREQIGRGEEITCNRELQPRTDTWHYTDIYFEFSTLNVNFNFELKRNSGQDIPFTGQASVVFTNLKVSISIKIVSIDENGFICTKTGDEEPRYTPGVVHRPPELDIDYRADNVAIGEVKAKEADKRVINKYILALSNMIKTDFEEISRRIWLTLLPKYTDIVMKMKNREHAIHILYETVMNPSRD